MSKEWEENLPEYTESEMKELFHREPRLRLRPEMDVSPSNDNGLFTQDVRRSESRRSLGGPEVSEHRKLTSKKVGSLKTSAKTRPKSSSHKRRRNRKNKMRAALKYSIDRYLQRRYRFPSRHQRSSRRYKPSRKPTKPGKHSSKKAKRSAKPVKESNNRFSLFPFLIGTPGACVQVAPKTRVGGPLTSPTGIPEIEDRALMIPNEHGIDMTGTSGNTACGPDQRSFPEHCPNCVNGVPSREVKVEQTRSSASTQTDSRVKSLLSSKMTASEIRILLEYRDRTPYPQFFSDCRKDIEFFRPRGKGPKHSIQTQTRSRVKSLLSANVSVSEINLVMEYRANKPEYN